MRKNPERAAWIILLFSFLIFCFCVISIPVTIRWYVFNSTETLTTRLTSIKGTVLARDAREEQSIPVTRGGIQSLEELSVITTDDTSQAILSFFDNSNVTLYHNTTAIIHRSRQPRFSLSPNPDEISIELVKGRIRATLVSTDSARIFAVRSPHAAATLSSGSYAVEVNAEQTQVTTRDGRAMVNAQGKTVIVNDSERTSITAGNAPTPSRAAEQDLIANGSFSPPITETWEATTFAPSNSVTATISVIVNNNRNVLALKSEGEDNIHTEASVRQDIDKDVEDFQSLQISADIRLNHQSLAGGGQIGTEFPVMIELAYRDVNGNDRNWFHGFYYEAPPENFILYDEVDNSNESITQFVWYPYESDNLFATLDDAKPVFIKYIRVYASGWIYDTMVSDIKLSVQQ